MVIFKSLAHIFVMNRRVEINDFKLSWRFPGYCVSPSWLWRNRICSLVPLQFMYCFDIICFGDRFGRTTYKMYFHSIAYCRL